MQRRSTLLNEQPAKQIAVPKTAVSILGKRRVFRDFIFKAQPAEPAIRQVQMGFFAQPPLGPNTVAIAHYQHADHQLRINRRTPNWAVEIGGVMAQVAQIKTPINAAQKVIGRNVIFKVERVKQPFLPTR
jgi:hypothetical protein